MFDELNRHPLIPAQVKNQNPLLPFQLIRTRRCVVKNNKKEPVIIYRQLLPNKGQPQLEMAAFMRMGTYYFVVHALKLLNLWRRYFSYISMPKNCKSACLKIKIFPRNTPRNRVFPADFSAELR